MDQNLLIIIQQICIFMTTLTLTFILNIFYYCHKCGNKLLCVNVYFSRIFFSCFFFCPNDASGECPSWGRAARAEGDN